MIKDLAKKIAFAEKIITAALTLCAERSERLELAYSGGKDSDVLLHLSRRVADKLNLSATLRPIYKNTTIDPKGTKSRAIEAGCEVSTPKFTFAQLIQRKGLPSRFVRFCCEFLKEYPIEPRVLVGVRSSESVKRQMLYKEPEYCRTYRGGKKVRQYMPLLNWTDEDIEAYIEAEGIHCHPLYYDENGSFHVERRLGCLGCPLQSEGNRINALRENPWLLRFYAFNLRKYFSAHPTSAITHRWEGNVYKAIYYNIRFREIPATNLLFEPNYKDVLETFFKISLPIY